MQNGVSRFKQFIADRFPPRKSYVGLGYVRQLIKAAPFQDDMTFLLATSLRFYLSDVYPLLAAQSMRLRKR